MKKMLASSLFYSLTLFSCFLSTSLFSLLCSTSVWCKSHQETYLYSIGFQLAAKASINTQGSLYLQRQYLACRVRLWGNCPYEIGGPLNSWCLVIFLKTSPSFLPRFFLFLFITLSLPFSDNYNTTKF